MATRAFFGEADGTGGNNDPLFLIGTSAGTADTSAHFLIRCNADATDSNGVPIVQMEDGTYEIPGLGRYWTQDANYTAANQPLLDGVWHMFTVVIDTNGYIQCYEDGTRDPGNNNGDTDENGNPVIGPPMPVTNAYYATNPYPYSSPPTTNPPPNGYVRWMMPGIFRTGSTAFGGFVRTGSVIRGVPCQINDIAFWNRVLCPDEIMFVMTNGLRTTGSPPLLPAVITSITHNADGSVTLVFHGVPHSINVIQATASLMPPVTWKNVSIHLADGGGAWHFIETSATNSTQFYRSYAS